METNNVNHYHSKGNFSSLDDLITNKQVDDEYINELYHRLTEMKKQRKYIEQDTQLLNVRVNCLKNEEGKTVKQIEQTKKKTKEKLLLLQKHKIEQQKRLRIEQEKEREIKAQRDRIMRQKVSLTNNTLIKKEAKMKKVIEDARLFKEELRSTNELLKCLKNEEIVNKKSNNEMIKSQHLINQEKRRAVLLEKKAQIKTDLETRIKEELILKAESDYKIRQMQEVEIDIMKRIQETTQMHKILLQEFEEVLLSGSNRYVNQDQFLNQNEENEEQEHKLENDQEQEVEEQEEQDEPQHQQNIDEHPNKKYSYSR